jgi:hypothetical protein
MKTLKKSLALVLAVVMVVGVLAISASAATYNDDAQIQYKEAVEVLSLVGVIDGKDGDNFDPTGTLTRQEAAKIVTYIINQKSADALSKTSSFTDVTAGSWAAGYISYCASKGIIAGTGNNKFDPTGTLTGTAWAKILLCALGYDADAEGFTSSDWAVKVQAESEANELTKGITGFDYDAAITREQACQMAFNALYTGTVTYTSNGQNITVSGGDVNVSITSGAQRNETKGATLQAKYFKDLEIDDTTTTDVFGRPAVTYTYPNKDDVQIASEAVATYTSAVNGKTLYNDLKLKATTSATVYKNGSDNDSPFSIVKNDTKSTLGGNGTTVEVYKTTDEDGNAVYTIAVIETNVGTVSKVTAAKGDNARTITVDGKTFETESFAAKDVVLYTTANDEIQSVSLAEVVENVAISKITGTSSFVAGGTTYKYSANDETEDGVIVISKGDASVDLYLDAQGNVILAKTHTANSTTSYAVVLKTTSTSDSTDIWSSTTTYYAQVVNTNGETEDLKITKASFDAITAGDIVTVSENNGVNTLTTKASAGAAATVTKGTVSVGSATANSATTYIVETISTVNGKEVPSYTVYTGYKTVPSMTSTATTIFTKDGYASIVYLSAVKATADTSKNVLVVATGKEQKVSDATYEDGYYEYNAVVNGEITTIKSATAISQDLYESASVADGLTSIGTKAAYTKVTGISYKNDVLAADASFDKDGEFESWTGNYVLSSDVSIFYVDTDNAITSISASDIATDYDDTAYVVTANGQVTAIYIFEVTAD